MHLSLFDKTINHIFMFFRSEKSTLFIAGQIKSFFTRAEDMYAEDLFVTQKALQIEDVRNVFITSSMRYKYLTWARCQNVLARAEDVCAEDVSVTQSKTSSTFALHLPYV